MLAYTDSNVYAVMWCISCSSLDDTVTKRCRWEKFGRRTRVVNCIWSLLALRNTKRNGPARVHEYMVRTNGSMVLSWLAICWFVNNTKVEAALLQNYDLLDGPPPEGSSLFFFCYIRIKITKLPRHVPTPCGELIQSKLDRPITVLLLKKVSGIEKHDHNMQLKLQSVVRV